MKLSVSTAKDLRSEFSARGCLTADVLLLRDAVALEYIERSRQEKIAVSGVAQVREIAVAGYQTLGSRSLSDLERLESWSQAADLVRSFSGRDLWFEVVLERPWSTYRAHIRYRLRNSGPWG